MIRLIGKLVCWKRGRHRWGTNSVVYRYCKDCDRWETKEPYISKLGFHTSRYVLCKKKPPHARYFREVLKYGKIKKGLYKAK